jgi:hypothetical protein
MKFANARMSDGKPRKTLYIAPYPPKDMTFKNIDRRRFRRKKSAASYFTVFERTVLLAYLIILSLFLDVKQIGPQENPTISAEQTLSSGSIKQGPSPHARHLASRNR